MIISCCDICVNDTEFESVMLLSDSYQPVSAYLYHGCWYTGVKMSQGISNHSICTVIVENDYLMLWYLCK